MQVHAITKTAIQLLSSRVQRSPSMPPIARLKSDERTNEATSGAVLQPSNDCQKRQALGALTASRPFQTEPQSVELWFKQRLGLDLSFHRYVRAERLRDRREGAELSTAVAALNNS
ncbi:hypothetical protein Q7C36_012750 [Tachysurus vachellii]|uniref:Uncharacterized protein n=1 Tax=Tachysurus vachellii TaxID=175792 RepID=A0AA88SLY5_TACVA|nr:hypothetical protein Q7C36_012750 [Tachysurus vachellii]